LPTWTAGTPTPFTARYLRLGGAIGAPDRLALLGVVDEIGVDAPGSLLLYGESRSSDTRQDLVDIIRYP
jgi:hypothetical protein